ncbi:MAG: MATE family efflux transporter [Clostridia bacterium]
MTNGVIWKQLLEFAMPLALGLLFQQLYNTVDTIVVGRFVGKEALAAVGGTGSIINTLVGICAGLSTGASVVISQCYGAHDYDRLHDAVHTTIVLTIIMCVIATIIGTIGVPAMLRMMDTPDDVLSQAQEYLTIYFAGIAGLLVYNMGSGILRAVGDSKRPLYFLCFSAIVNVVLDLLFVIKFNMGIAGVGYATIISQFLSAILVMYVLTHTNAPYRLFWKQLRIKAEVLKQILSVGFPAAIQQGITAFSNVFVQSYINAFGSACMAGWSSFNKIDIYIMIPIQSLALTATTFVGQNFGANKLERANKGVAQSMLMALGFTAVLIVVMLFVRRPMLLLFSNDDEVIQYGMKFISMILPFYFACCSIQVYAAALRGIGKSTTAMIIMLSSFVAFRQIYLYVSKLLGGGLEFVALSYPVGWVMCGILMFIFYRRSTLGRLGGRKNKPVTGGEV